MLGIKLPSRISHSERTDNSRLILIYFFRHKQPLNNQAPSKQFYFGMIESKQASPREHLKEFPGLGSPIIEEIGDFRLIEQKLLGYHDEDAEFEKFNAKLREDCKMKNCE